MTSRSIGRFSSKEIRNFEGTAIKAIKHTIGTVVAFEDSLVQLINSRNFESVIWSNSSRQGTKIMELAVFPDDSLYVLYETGCGIPSLSLLF